MKKRMYYYLIHVHHFQAETLDLLNYKNLKRLAIDYGFKNDVF
jgi:hypothetical protein